MNNELAGDMVHRKEEAERLRIGIRGGWTDVQKAVAWADRKIERTAHPDPPLLDLALSSERTREEVAALLQAVPGSADAVAVTKARQRPNGRIAGPGRHIGAALCTAVILATAFVAAQGRYMRAEEDAHHDLVITTSAGERIVVGKSDHTWADQKQSEFRDIAISRDGAAVGWVAYYPNCCTSYTIPVVVEVYAAGRRHTFQPAIAPWHWCFVDGPASIAAISTTVHGPQNEVLELWDVSTGAKRGEFSWMDGETYPRAPAWVVAARRARASKTHECALS